jgi:hypothetical protein
MKISVEEKEHTLSLRDADRDVGGRATQDAVAERARERGYLIRRLFNFIPSP